MVYGEAGAIMGIPFSAAGGRMKGIDKPNFWEKPTGVGAVDRR